MCLRVNVGLSWDTDGLWNGGCVGAGPEFEFEFESVAGAGDGGDCAAGAEPDAREGARGA